jgi:hypothetical protein
MEAFRFCAFDHEIDLSAQSGATGNFGVCCNNPLANAVSFHLLFSQRQGRGNVMQSCVKIALYLLDGE